MLNLYGLQSSRMYQDKPSVSWVMQVSFLMWSSFVDACQYLKAKSLLTCFYVIPTLLLKKLKGVVYVVFESKSESETRLLPKTVKVHFI